MPEDTVTNVPKDRVGQSVQTIVNTSDAKKIVVTKRSDNDKYDIHYTFT